MDARGNFGPEDHFRSKSKPDGAPDAPKFPGLLSSAAFIAGFKPPDYLIDGVIQCGRLYSFTARTGAGKTALALLIAASIGVGRSIAGRDVKKGSVVYFAGENPDDVRARWIAMAEETGFDAETIPVHFVPGAFPLSALLERVRMEVTAIGGAGMVVIDTSAAFFGGTDENSNVEMLRYALVQRELTKLPGNPTVIVCCHPVKNASDDNLLPRGGGSYLNEMDSNLTAIIDDTIVHMHWQGKHRGPDFDPLAFELLQVKTQRLKDSRGRLMPTVVARVLGASEEGDREANARRDESTLLEAMLDNPGASVSTLLTKCGWPHKSRVSRTMERLRKDRFVEKKRGKWRLTASGKTEAETAGETS